MLDTKFERFTGGPSHRMNLNRKLRATINSRGMIYLNKRLFAALGSPTAVALFYSREDMIIAIEPAFELNDETFPVQKHQAGRVVRASTFCRHYRIRVPNTEEFRRPNLAPDKTLLLNLRETTTVGGIVRKRGKAKESADGQV